MSEQTEGHHRAEPGDRAGDLFSRQASDNAEVVPPSAPRTHDELWSTEVGEPGPEDVYGPATAEPLRSAEGPPPLQANDVFSADPVERDGDVLDEAVDEPPPSLQFGVGGDTDPAGSSLWRDLPPREPNRRSGPDWSVLHEDPPADAPQHQSSGADDHPSTDDDVPAEDPNGFEAAVRRIDPAARQRAEVPLVVAGALLLPGEHVDEVLTGAMLGSPAVLVVTGARVLVVNDRRWQPVVDVYRLDHRLTVRGRSDRGVAAISLADEDRLSMVDGITDVDAAVAVAERIRAVVDRT